MFTGVAEISAAFRLRRHVAGEALLAIAGVLSIAFAALLIFAPLAGAIVLALWLGAHMFAFGVVLIALGFRLRTLARGRLGHSGNLAPVH